MNLKTICVSIRQNVFPACVIFGMLIHWFNIPHPKSFEWGHRNCPYPNIVSNPCIYRQKILILHKQFLAAHVTVNNSKIRKINSPKRGSSCVDAMPCDLRHTGLCKVVVGELKGGQGLYIYHELNTTYQAILKRRQKSAYLKKNSRLDIGIFNVNLRPIVAENKV